MTARLLDWLARPRPATMVYGQSVRRSRDGPKPFAGSVWPTFPANSIIVWIADFNDARILRRVAGKDNRASRR
jgi:hypothetical protein